MTDNVDGDGFTLVRRRKRGKGPTFASSKRNPVGEERQRNLEIGQSSYSKGERRVGTAAIRKKILRAKEELTISDFYRSFLDSLQLVQALKRLCTFESRSTPSVEKCNENTEEGIPQQRRDSSTRPNSCFSGENIHGNISTELCHDRRPECADIESRTTLHHVEGEKWCCTRTECSEHPVRYCQNNEPYTNLKIDSTGGSHSDDLHVGGVEVGQVKGHACDEATGQSVQTVVCYGLGNLSDCVIARYQLALLLLICDALKITYASCCLYDPRFTVEETEILTSLGLAVIPKNEECKRVITEPTLFYMPHCGKPLYNNLLWANWTVEGLTNLVIIGNSFGNMHERLPSRVLEDFSYLHQIMPHAREVPVRNNFRFADIFNDTSIHVFPSKTLPKIPSAFWDRHHEPEYDPDAETEIILQQ